MRKAEKRRQSPPRRNGERGKAATTRNGPERLQKVIAAAGIASRRQCEQLILEGRVEVDQQVVTTLGTKVDLEEQTVRVDGVPLVQSRQVYYMINKPKGVVCTHRDPAGRMRIVDLVPDESARMFSVGRLDRESEGLILLTNDGGLAQKLAHPRYGVEKTYHVQAMGVSRETWQGISAWEAMRATAFIIGSGPQQTMRVCLDADDPVVVFSASKSFNKSVTKPWCPIVPSSVLNRTSTPICSKRATSARYSALRAP